MVKDQEVRRAKRMKRLFGNAIKNLCSNGGGYSENEKSFIKKCKSSENKAALQEVFGLMGIKRAIILLKIGDNPIIIFLVYRLMKEMNLKIQFASVSFYQFLNVNKRDAKRNKKLLRDINTTIYITESLDKQNIGGRECIIFDLERLCIYLDNAKTNFTEKVMLPIANTVENCFASIGVCGENKLAEKLYLYLKQNKNIKVFYFHNKELCKSSTGNKMELMTKECPEMLFQLTLHSKEIWFKNRMLYCIDMDNCIMHRTENSVNADIVWNIIPYLNQKGVRTLLISPPEEGRMREKESLKKLFIENKKRLNTGKIKHTSALLVPPDISKELAEAVTYHDFSKGYMDNKNYHGKYVNFINGIRYTPGNPKEYANQIQMFGPCILRGSSVEDKNTISSLLRKKLKNNFYVVNKGSHFWNMNLTIRLTKFTSGDIAVIFVSDKGMYQNNKIPVLNLTSCFRKIPALQKHLADCLYHCDSFVNQYIADEIYQYMNKNHYFDGIEITDHKMQGEQENIVFGSNIKRESGLKASIDLGLKKWLNQLEHEKHDKNVKCGAIVMNCNPFTRGHLYLIETAAREVDVLYVFVVQEDKSVFPFQDRIRLVKEGTKHISNVTVLPSGQYMISASTMPGYFEKEDLQNEKLDASQDLGIFSQYIAPALNITVRFAGEEPLDHFTRQYNESMKEIFPEYGIKFMEIPRKEEEGEVISASRVRRLLKEKNWEEIRKMVPDCTYYYLFHLSNYK